MNMPVEQTRSVLLVEARDQVGSSVPFKWAINLHYVISAQEMTDQKWEWNTGTWVLLTRGDIRLAHIDFEEFLARWRAVVGRE